MARTTWILVCCTCSARLQPFLAFRNIHDLTRANLVANTRSEILPNGIKMKLYEGFPYLNMQTSKKSEFIHVPDWHYNVEYKEEKLRGYKYQEDLFVPGYFEMSLKKGESITFSAGTKEQSTNTLTRQFNRELKKQVDRNSFENCLENAATQLISKKDKETRIISKLVPKLISPHRYAFIKIARMDKIQNKNESTEKTCMFLINLIRRLRFMI